MGYLQNLFPDVILCESCGLNTDWVHPVSGLCECCCLEDDAFNDSEE